MVQNKDIHNYRDKPLQTNFHIEKRSHERVHTNMDIRFYCGTIFYSGTAMNISPGGMFIKTVNCLPMTSGIVIIIRDDNTLLQVISKVKRLNTIKNHIDGMGIEVVNPSNIYRNFVSSLGSL